MRKLFLTSSAATVMDSVARHFGKSVAGQKCAFILTASEAEEGDKWWLREDRDVLTVPKPQMK